MSAYLGDDVSEDLCQHLFWAFHKQVAVNSPSLSQTIIDSVAATVVSNSQQDVHKFDQRRRKSTCISLKFAIASVLQQSFMASAFSKYTYLYLRNICGYLHCVFLSDLFSLMLVLIFLHTKKKPPKYSFFRGQSHKKKLCVLKNLPFTCISNIVAVLKFRHHLQPFKS